jgi:hypothetical protein
VELARIDESPTQLWTAVVTVLTDATTMLPFRHCFFFRYGHGRLHAIAQLRDGWRPDVRFLANQGGGRDDRRIWASMWSDVGTIPYSRLSTFLCRHLGERTLSAAAFRGHGALIRRIAGRCLLGMECARLHPDRTDGSPPR